MADRSSRTPERGGKRGGDRSGRGSGRSGGSGKGAGGSGRGTGEPGHRGGGGSRRGREPELPSGGSRPRLMDVPPASGGNTLAEDTALALLAAGELTVEGRLIDASNATLYCQVEDGDLAAACVYKPVAGERPLWDFPSGTLAAREVAAYAVSRAAGWNIVPPTIMRDGPFGPGMCQLWIDADPGADLVALARRRDHARLREMAVFDAVVNNADRKIGHLLPVSDGRLFGCDHGVCFGEEYKLRTVLWQWRGQSIPEPALCALGLLSDGLAGGDLAGELAELLSESEVEATRQRIELLIQHKVHPHPPENWPAVPWPPV